MAETREHDESRWPELEYGGQRKPYRQPRLTEYGDIRQLTEGSGGTESDFPEVGSREPT
jgi:hypothetical protein